MYSKYISVEEYMFNRYTKEFLMGSKIYLKLLINE